MSKNISLTLSGPPEASLATLYLRARESQRPDTSIKDEREQWR